MIDRDGRGGDPVPQNPWTSPFMYEDIFNLSPLENEELFEQLALENALEANEQYFKDDNITEPPENSESENETLDEYGRTPLEQSRDVAIGVMFISLPFTPFIEIPGVTIIVPVLGQQFGYHAIPRYREIINEINNDSMYHLGFTPWDPND